MPLVAQLRILYNVWNCEFRCDSMSLSPSQVQTNCTVCMSCRPGLQHFFLIQRKDVILCAHKEGTYTLRGMSWVEIGQPQSSVSLHWVQQHSVLQPGTSLISRRENISWSYSKAFLVPDAEQHFMCMQTCVVMLPFESVPCCRVEYCCCVWILF